MPQYVKVGGTWQTVEETTKCGSVKVSGTWRDVQNSYVKVAGVWRSVCSTSPEVLLTLTNTDSGGQYNVRLDWTNINIVQTGAEIYRNGSFIASVGASTFTFTDNNLACNTTYLYYVRVNGSVNSNTVNRTTPACPTTTPPPATTQPPANCNGPSPTISNAQASSTGQTTATVSFNASGMYSYQIYGGGYNSGTINSTATSVTHNITGLTCGTSYTFSVAAMAVSNGVPNQPPASGCQTVGGFPQITTSSCGGGGPDPTEPPVGPTYYAAACCNGSVSLYSNTTSCAAAQTYFNNNCSTVTNFACNVGGTYPTVSCATIQTYYFCCAGDTQSGARNGDFGSLASAQEFANNVCGVGFVSSGPTTTPISCAPVTTTAAPTTTPAPTSAPAEVCGSCQAYSFTSPTCNGEDSYVGNYTGYRRTCTINGVFSRYDTSGCPNTVFNGFGSLLDANSTSCGGSGTTPTAAPTAAPTTQPPTSYCESIGCFDAPGGGCLC